MTGVELVRNEGLAALYKGLSPAVARGLFYGGRPLGSSTIVWHPALWKLQGYYPELPLFLKIDSLQILSGIYAGVRLGCYGPAKTALGATKDNNSIVRNIAAGSLSGAMAAWASNPIDLIKTRLQSKENPHKTSAAVVRSIVQTDGVRGLWRGTVPSTVRLLSRSGLSCWL